MVFYTFKSIYDEAVRNVRKNFQYFDVSIFTWKLGETKGRAAFMGTYLYEYVEEEPFKEKDILLAQLKEVLHDFGECGLEQIELFNRRIVFMDQDNFSREKNDENLIVLAYNRFEHDKWEPSFLELDPDKFTGIRSWAIGSKIGYRQHYYAMAVARVLCECYSNGKYIVYGDISKTTFFRILAYIGKRYGFGLVERFIDNRLNVHTIVKDFDIADCYWGIREVTFYKETFFKSDFKEWENYMEGVCSDDRDLTLAERGEKPVYICTYAYLGIKLLSEAIKGKIEIENPELDIQKLIDVFRFYNLDMFYQLSDAKELFANNKLPENLIKYEKFYEKYIENFTLKIFYSDPEIVLKIIEETIQEKNKEHGEDIIRKFQIELQDIYTNFEDFEKKPNKTQGEKLIPAINSYYLDSEKEHIIETRKKFIAEIKAIMDEEDFDSYFTGSPLLNELFGTQETTFSVELDKYLKNIFSTENFKRFKTEREKYKASEEFTDNFYCLSDIANKVYQEDKLLLTKNLVYGLLETLKQDTGKLRLELLHFFVNNSSGVEREAILWVIGDNKLYKKYVSESFEAYEEKNIAISELKAKEIGGVSKMGGLGDAIYKQGCLDMLVSLVKEGLLNLGEASKRAEMTEDDFSQIMNDCHFQSEEELLGELDKGIDDMENGRVVPHEEAMEMIYERLESKEE